MENKIAKNRTSPKNENDYIEAYKKLNPKANKQDNYDIAAVIAKEGTRGHGLLPEDINRSHELNLTFIVMLTIAKGHIKNKQKNIRSLVA